MQIRRKTAQLWGIGAGVGTAVILALLATFGFRAGVAYANGYPRIFHDYVVCNDGVCCTVNGTINYDPYICDLNVNCTGLGKVLQCETETRVGVSCDINPDYFRIFITANCAAPETNPSVWLADVCQLYYGGMYDQYGQMTFDTDFGTALYVGPSAEGPWTAVEANGPQWVVTMSDLDALAADLGVATEDLWVTAGNGNDYAEPQLLSSMVADRAAGWGDDCIPVDGGPAE